MVKVQTNGNGKIYVSSTGGVLLGNDTGGGSVTVDSAISSTSENPVQNKVIYAALNNKQDTSNLVTSISSSSTDVQYPSAKCVYDTIENNIISGQLPPQSGNNGKFLATDGNTTSWNNTVDYNNITNCITEIPQDIKLELNNGTLTLKAGSKVYIPNGFDRHTPKFDKVVIESDIIVDSPTIDGPIFIYYANKTVIGVDDEHQCSEHLTVDNGLWYNTRDNFISFIAGGEVSADNASLPLAIINASNGDWTSIDQVFNGFGYIGSTVFALPGVKGLIPNGRNADGSLKNIEFTVDRVLTGTIRDGETRDNVVIGFSPYDRRNFFGFSLSAYYDGNTNFNKERGRNWSFALIGNASYSATKFTSFTPKTVFHAVDYNEYNEYIQYVHEVNGKQDKSTAVNYDNISNCITELPQNIVKLSDHETLWVKGIAYIPNGFESDGVTPKFIKYNGTNENHQNLYQYTGSYMFFVYNGVSGVDYLPVSYCYSGPTAPTEFFTSNNDKLALWYDTTNNLVKFTRNGGSTWTSGYSLPIYIATYSHEKSKFTSIDQVFNGFGYIGSTVYALPGVKGLIPNGRNADGSLKSIEFTLDKVLTFNSSVSNSYEPQMLLLDSALNIQGPTAIRTISYNEVYNYTTYNDINQSWIPIITFVYNNNKITNFTPKTVFHALDYNDKSTISGWSMPSSRYIDLTLGASGSTYTAPANGYFYLVKVAGKDMGDIRFNNKTKDIVQELLPKTSTNWMYVRMEAQKGDVFEIVYNATGDTKKFRFIYAEGE